MITRKKFEIALEEWRQHCSNTKVQASSSVRAYTSCKGYRDLVAMGPGIFPFIKELYSQEYEPANGNQDIGFESLKDLGLPQLVAELGGDDFSVPKRMQGKIQKVREFTAAWLGSHTKKYA